MNTDEKKSQLRLWPAAVMAVFIPLVRFGMPAIFPNTVIAGIFGGLAGALAVIVWWAFFSKASALERWGAVIMMVVSMVMTAQFIDTSIATGGQGSMFYMFAFPITCIAFTLWSLLANRLSKSVRFWTMIMTILISTGIWTLFRIDGITGDFTLELAWRWSPTPEEELLSNYSPETLSGQKVNLSLEKTAAWPGFRGPNRNSIVVKANIQTDWKNNPPRELWRKPIGPGCSSFAVSGNALFTQEQRGEDEAISCYDINSGDLVWLFTYKARFYDSHAGAGPRSTPFFHEGIIYAMGATGMLHAIDAATGKKIWERNSVEDTNQKHSGWGYTSSPLVIGKLVVVAVVGQLAAYDIATGEVAWTGLARGDSYSSPHLLTISGIEQIVLMSGNGATSLSPKDGRILWEYSWAGDSRIVQPWLLEDGKMLISDPAAKSMRCIQVKHEDGDWMTEELWTSSDIKPNFNDFVVHNGYAYGYTGPMLVCVDAKDGSRMWRGGRYGGQILLLPEQELLVILSEKGEIALVKASPDKFEELGKIKAIDGKTWNHPVIVGDRLIVRNSVEMAAFQLSAENI